MLNRSELEQYKNRLGFTIWQVERDYLQHLFLLFLSKRIGNELVFKGGTALQKTLGLNRFSIDLDFTQQESIPKNLFPSLEREFSDFGCSANFKQERKTSSQIVKFALQGPLYSGTERTLTVLRIEISSREKVVLKPDAREVIPIYPDAQPYLIKIMMPEEILAEKVRAIFTRTRARDVFDLHFLLAKDIALRESLINKKLECVGLTYSKTRFLEHIKKVENIWKNELSQLVSRVPEYAEVVKQIKIRI